MLFASLLLLDAALFRSLVLFFLSLFMCLSHAIVFVFPSLPLLHLMRTCTD